MKKFWRVILCLSVMAQRGDARDVDCHKGVEVGGC